MRAFFFGGEHDGEVIEVTEPSDYFQFYMKPPKLDLSLTRGPAVCNIKLKIQEYRRDFDCRHQLVYRCMDDNGEG